jgi:hypothetical protein
MQTLVILSQSRQATASATTPFYWSLVRQKQRVLRISFLLFIAFFAFSFLHCCHFSGFLGVFFISILFQFSGWAGRTLAEHSSLSFIRSSLAAQNCRRSTFILMGNKMFMSTISRLLSMSLFPHLLLFVAKVLSFCFFVFSMCSFR